MADIRWTDEQISAIETRGRNILVSAAAGSGKTTVLVERVIRMITDPEHPADISSMIIMTFTRAAAAQMREKIYRSIRAALHADPENAHLRRQLAKVHSADICTIDSLCMNIVRNNFQQIDIDPLFRMADESEIAILRADVLKDLIEERYKDPDEDFLQFVNFYTDKSDSKLEKIILTMYDFAQSHPDPEDWIRRSVAPYAKAAGLGAAYEDDETEWLKQLARIVDSELLTIREEAATGLVISNMNHGPFKYSGDFEKVIELVDSITGEDKMFNLRGEAICEALDEWTKAPIFKAADEVDEKLKNDGKAFRDDIKARLVKLRDTYFSETLEASYEDMALCNSVAGTIASLTIDFGRKFRAAKHDKKIADFNDISHYALQVLIEHDDDGRISRDENGNIRYTQTADRMAAEITEIIVDEYQDTNMLQEYIINALSAERFGRPDVFMVGDVKQSIYGFRMACPKLFSDKYDAFEEDGEVNKKILLNANFRSRAEITNLVNDIFSQTMIREVGDIDYNDGHAMICEGTYPEPEYENMFVPEFLYFDESGTDGRVCEAYNIARKIEELTESAYVTDSESGILRRARFGDIAILTRTSDNPELEQELESRKIPVIRSSDKGFLDTFEVRLLVDLLRIIDNPYQDIPFTAVITSPLGGVDSNTLARIKIAYTGENFCVYEACREYREFEPLNSFIEKLADFRRRNTYMDTYSLMEYVIEQTMFIGMISAMPGGKSRKANIELMMDRAAAYSESSYSGLYNFLRYLDQTKELERELGQAHVLEGDADAVRMMTIHKSKGLEFPIVILARSGKEHNRTDINDSIVLDRELGLGIELRDPVERIVTKTLIMETIRAVKKRDLNAEELRLLYVALTRAKEKLIITASANHMQGVMEKWGLELYRPWQQLSYGSILLADSFMKVMGRALIRHEDMEPVRTFADTAEVIYPQPFTSSFRVSVSDMSGVEESRIIEAEEAEDFLEKVYALTSPHEASEDAQTIGREISGPYRFEAATRKPVKISASQLEDHTGDKEVTRSPIVYITDDGTLHGAERGTAYHHFFELMDFSIIERLQDAGRSTSEASDIASQMISGLSADGMLNKEECGTIDPDKIAMFLTSDIGKRMCVADRAGTLKREAQFVMGHDDEDGEQRLVQGIIDAFFIENDHAVIVDYKTDRNKTDEEFINTYRGQLEAYRDAVSAATGTEVSELLIYSVEKGKTISI